MSIVRVLDHSSPRQVMAEKNTTAQTMYSLGIPANTLSAGGALRVTAMMSRVLKTPESCFNNCPDCVPFAPSVRDTAGIALCASDTGDGCAVSCPGDYSSDPAYYDFACASYYGDFAFGMNAGPGVWDNTPPSYFTTTPSLWQYANGSATLNSSCGPYITTKQLRFDLQLGRFGSPPTGGFVNYQDITPATFQTALDDWDSTHTGFDLLDCTRDGVGYEYMSSMDAFYVSDSNSPIAGIAIISNDGSDTTNITGFGLLINRVNNTLQTVKWTGNDISSYTVLNEVSYTPIAGDEIHLDVKQSCSCPMTGRSELYPSGGYVETYNYTPGIGFAQHGFISTQPTSGNPDGSVSPALWKSLGYGALLSIPVDNGSCDNLLTFRNVWVNFAWGQTLVCV